MQVVEEGTRNLKEREKIKIIIFVAPGSAKPSSADGPLLGLSHKLQGLGCFRWGRWAAARRREGLVQFGM